jgi:uncharacterized protein YciI
MFIVFLKFSAQRARAPQFLEGHQRWIDRGFADGVFLLVGSLPSGAGGAILAHGVTAEELRRRIDEDPFVEHDVVFAEVHQVLANRADERLAFLLRPAGGPA